MTGLRPPRTSNRRCWARSTGSTAFPAASNRLESIRPISASSSIERNARLMRNEDIAMSNEAPVDRFRALHRLSALVGLSVALGGCVYTGTEVVTASIPEDYRLRHPIAIEEANRSVTIFVGHARGGLSASQRTDVIGLARTW